MEDKILAGLISLFSLITLVSADISDGYGYGMIGGHDSEMTKEMHMRMAKGIYCDEDVDMMGRGMMGSRNDGWKNDEYDEFWRHGHDER